MQARFLALLLPGFIPLFAQTAAPESGTVEGTVTNSITGQPIAGARVRLQNFEPDPLFTVTDDKGHYRFTGLAFGGYGLQAAKPGFIKPGDGPNSSGGPSFFQVSAAQPQAERQITLQPQAVIAGRVLDASGAPLQDAGVILLQDVPLRPGQRQPPAGLPRTSQMAQVTTNDLGEFRVASLSEGAYYLQVRPSFGLQLDKSYRETYYPRSPNFAGAKSIEVSPGQEIRGLDIRMTELRGVRVAGRLINAPENPPGERPKA